MLYLFVCFFFLRWEKAVLLLLFLLLVLGEFAVCFCYVCLLLLLAEWYVSVLSLYILLLYAGSVMS